MRLHYYTLDSAPYSYEAFIAILDDEEFTLRRGHEELDELLNSNEVIDVLYEEDMEVLKSKIAVLFDLSTNGVFDWEEKTGEYFEHYEQMLHFLKCDLETNSGAVLSSFVCTLGESMSFCNGFHSLYIPNFYCGNGEPEGAQLALDLVDDFMRSNQWHVGFYDNNGLLITDIAHWSKNNVLDVTSIKPIIWFGHKDEIAECWSITPHTSDLFIKNFWDDYFEGALDYICQASSGLGIYYSVWEYGLNYDESLFKEIKSRCPIDIESLNLERANALYNLIISIYNKSKDTSFPVIQNNVYLHDVIDCVVCVTSDAFKYSFSKPYRFKSSLLGEVNRETIEDILLDDSEFVTSFNYLKDIIIDRCDLSSYQEVKKTVDSVVSLVQEQLNNEMLCQIIKDGATIKIIPFDIDLIKTDLYLPKIEIENIVFMKALIAFLKRGQWHTGYIEASQLPDSYNSFGQRISQEGIVPVIWFNDTEEIVKGFCIWPAQEQYMLSLIWESAASFCSTVFNNIKINNEYKNTLTYSQLEQEFNRVKTDCPIEIRTGNEPIDFKELESIVKRNMRPN